MQKNKNIKVLYVEDDHITRENGIEYLENYFENIYEASNAIEALKIYNEIKPEIVLTDIQMPKLNGLEFIKRIREKSKTTQVIVLSAFSNKEYLFEAIELQLVKYLIKPIKENELDKAIQTCIDAIENKESNIVKLSDTSYFDTYNASLKVDNELIKLRAKEIDLLQLLIKNKNKHVSYEEIENVVWQESVMTKDALKTLIKNLKQKLPKDMISNLTGIGYKIEL